MVKANEKWIDRDGEIVIIWKIRKATAAEYKSLFRRYAALDEKVIEYATEDEMNRWETSRQISTEKANEGTFLSNFTKG